MADKSEDADVAPSRCSFSSDLDDWLWNLCTMSSLHGFHWVHKARELTCQCSLMTLCTVVIVAMPIVIVQQAVRFMLSERQQVSIEWGRYENATYPNITVCHPKFFDTRLMASTYPS